MTTAHASELVTAIEPARIVTPAMAAGIVDAAGAVDRVTNTTTTRVRSTSAARGVVTTAVAAAVVPTMSVAIVTVVTVGSPMVHGIPIITPPIGVAAGTATLDLALVWTQEALLAGPFFMGAKQPIEIVPHRMNP